MLDAPTILQTSIVRQQQVCLSDFEKKLRNNCFYQMKLFGLLVFGPVVESIGELRIQLPGRNGKRL